MKGISIPNPCSENFDKMTPTEKGAFCNKCATDTHDFRFLSQEQILQRIVENKGQLCGRIHQSQLDEINEGYAEWKKENKKTFQSKFILALVMVFGLTLFSCNEEEARVIDEVNRSQIVRTVDQDKVDKVNEMALLVENAILEREFLLNEKAPLEYEMMEAHMDTLIYELGAPAEVIVYEEMRTYVTGGVMLIREDIMHYAERVVQLKEMEDTLELLPEPILNEVDPFETKAFPNPTTQLSTVQVDVKETGIFDVMMYNMNGQLVQQIHSGELDEGEQRFQVDLGDYERGLYIVTVISGEQRETLKIQKL